MKVTYVDSMGTDLSVVDAARVSFDKKSKGYDDDGTLSVEDQGLIQFLARGCSSGDWQKLIDEAMANGGYIFDNDWDQAEEWLKHIRRMPDHWTPFAHTAITLHVKAPIFVARQLGKHQVGFVQNEVSRRYVTTTPEFYMPECFREAAPDKKQGSLDVPHKYNEKWLAEYQQVCEDALHQYEWMIREGVAPEQARMILPQSMYTEWYWTANLYAWSNLYIQRSDSHAQKESQEVAKMIDEIIYPLFPYSWKALTK